MRFLDFPPAPPGTSYPELRSEVRAFLCDTLGPDYGPRAGARSWMGFDAEFSAKLGAQGYLGMTFPKEYGGHGRSMLERYVVIEELLAAGAPVAAHWIADRQSGNLLLHYGSEEQRREILPRISRGEAFFCIGMSEPDAGSDLAAARTRAVRVDGGWRVNGAKIWTTYAHRAQYMILFCRSGSSDDRHGGVSQFLVDLTLPGIRISPIHDMQGEHHLNEVAFTDVFLPDTALIGTEGDGWKQVMGELAFERSGPDRFLSAFALLNCLAGHLRASQSPEVQKVMGRICAQLITLRSMSRSIAAALVRGENAALQAAIVKDLGAALEQDIPEISRALVATEGQPDGSDLLASVYAYTLQSAPTFSLRGGTREILRGIIARGLELR